MDTVSHSYAKRCTHHSNNSYCQKNGDGSPTSIFKCVVEGLVKDGLVSQYLPFYNERHTFGTHLVRSGKVDLKTASQIMGNSPEVLMKNYLAPNHDIDLPELF